MDSQTRDKVVMQNTENMRKGKQKVWGKKIYRTERMEWERKGKKKEGKRKVVKSRDF